MRKRHFTVTYLFLRIPILPVMALLFSSCAVPMEPSVRDVAGLHMVVRVAPDSASNGDTVVVRASLTNITTATVALSSGAGCLAGVLVRGEGVEYGSFSGVTTGGCVTGTGSWHIPPNDSLVQEWSIGVGVYGVVVPPGDYVVTVVFNPVPRLGALETLLFVR